MPVLSFKLLISQNWFLFLQRKGVPYESYLEMLSVLYPSIVGTLKVAASYS